MATTFLRMPVRCEHGAFAPLSAILILALAAGILTSWWVALGIAVLGAGVVAAPLALLPALVVVVSAASFVDNDHGQLTLQLSVLTLLLLYVVACLLAAHDGGRWGLPRAGLTTAVLLLEGSTLIAGLHGAGAGNSLRYLGLELLPLLGFVLALFVGGLRLERKDLRFALGVFVLVALGHVALGLFGYASGGARRGGIFFTPVTGMLGLLAFNLLLRARRHRAGLVLLTSACLLHQMISLTRGYWLGVFAGLLFSIVAYGRWGAGAVQRWRRLGASLGPIVLLLAVGAMGLAAWFGWGNVGQMLGTRLASSLGTGQSAETASNVVRLAEWYAALARIRAAPWLGYGLGYELHYQFPIYHVMARHWIVHEHYLWISLKQGLVGLFLLLGVFAAAMRTSWVAGARLEGGDAAWADSAAAATVYIAVLGLTNYPIAMVNCTFMLAFLWGVALALRTPARMTFTWRRATAGTSSP